MELLLPVGFSGTNNGQFMGLHDVTVDPEGKFVYSLELNNRVQKFNFNGTFITKWRYNGTGGCDALRSPHQVAVNSMGVVYLTDRNGNLRKIVEGVSCLVSICE